MKKLFASLIICYVFLISTTKPVSAAVFNVTNTAQLETALNTAESNGEDDTINLAAGTYSGANFTYETTDTDSISILGNSPNDTVITNPAGDGLVVYSAGAVMITDISFNNSIGNGVTIYGNGNTDTGTFDVEIYDITSHDNGGAGINMRNDWGLTTIGGSVHISNSSFYNNASEGTRIQGLSATFTVEVEVNKFYNNDFNGLYIDVIGDNSDIRVERNHIYSNDNSGLYIYNGCDCEAVVVANVINNNNTGSNPGAGVNIIHANPSPTTTKLLVLAHNTIAENSTTDNGGGAYIDVAVDNADYRIFNNIFYNNTALEGDDVFAGMSNWGTYHILNNIVQEFCMNGTTDTCEIDDFETTYSGGNVEFNVSGDPEFIGTGPVAGDYKPVESSIAIGAGSMLGGSGPGNDYEGESYTAPPNAGAFATFVEEDEEPTPTPTPSPTPTKAPQVTHNHAPTSPAQAPSCSDEKPVGLADLFQLDRSANAVTLYFTPVNDHVKQYHVIYGFQKGDARFGQIGAYVTQATNNGVQSITIRDLDPKATYWFQVSPVNGCAVGDWSNWLEAKRITTQKSSFFRWF